MKKIFETLKKWVGRNEPESCVYPTSRIVVHWNNRHKRDAMRIFNAGCPRILTKQQAAEFAGAYSTIISDDDKFELMLKFSAIAGTLYADDDPLWTPYSRAVGMHIWGKRGIYYDPYPRSGDLFIKAAKDFGGHIDFESLELQSRPTAGDRRRFFRMLAQPSFGMQI